MKKMATVKLLSMLIVFLLATFISCSEDSKNNITTPENSETEFEYGEPNTYAVESSPNFTVYDQEMGVTLSFPEGGTGNVLISAITSSPFVPVDGGNGIKIDYSGDTPIYLVIDTSDGYSAKVFEYGIFMGCYNSDIGTGEIWATVPKAGINGSEISFILMMPYKLSKTAAPSTVYGSNNYWTVRIEQDINELIHEVELKDSISNFYKRFENTLPISIKSKVKMKRDSKKLTIVFLDPGIIFKNVTHYSGLWFKSFITGFFYEPTIHLFKNSNRTDAAHETGHYLIHLLVGDDLQNKLELQDTGSNHGIGDIVGRNILLEELAYFAEFFLIESGGSQDLHRPYDLFKHRSPLINDFPSYESFSALLLAQLTRTESKIRDFANDQFQNIPLVNLSYGEVFEIISKGATDVNKLRENIENYLGSKAPALPIIAHRVGWRYTLTGKLVDSNGDPVSGATIEPLAIYNGITYKGSFTGGSTSNNDGSFYILEEGFPGKSILRIKLVNGDSTDIPIEIDWDKPTTETIELGDLEINQNIKVIEEIFMNISLNEVTRKYTDLHGNTITSIDEFSLFATIYNKSGKINGNTISFLCDTTDNGTHTNTEFSITFDDIVNRTNIVRFNAKHIWTTQHGDNVTLSVSVDNIPFELDQTLWWWTYTFEEGNLSQYITDFKWEDGDMEVVSYSSQGYAQIRLTYKDSL